MKTQTKKTLITKLITLLAISFLSLMSVFLMTSGSASAAPAGCYARSGSSTGVSTIEYDCPTEGYARGVAAGNCYIFAAGSSGISTTGVLTDCDAITVGSREIQTSSPAGGVDNSSSVVDVDPTPVNTDCEDDVLDRSNCQILNWLVIGINFLSALAGMVIVASLMIAGYLYMTARDNAGQIEKAKSRIVQTMLALALLIFMYALLNFLVPGGVL